MKRREFLYTAGVFGSAEILKSELDRRSGQEKVWDELDEVIWKNSRFVGKTKNIIEGFTRHDFNYGWDNFQRIKNSLVETGDFVEFKSYTPDMVGLSNPGQNTVMRLDGLGRVSGWMKDGHEQVPFEPTRKINSEEGIFAGINRDNEVDWLPFAASVDRERIGPGSVRFSYELDDLEVVQEATVVPGANSGKLDFDITNSSSKPIDADFVVYGRASSNAENQNPVFFKSEPNHLEASDGLYWQSMEPDEEFSLELDADVSESGAFRPLVEDWFSEYREKSGRVNNFFDVILERLMDESEFQPEGEGSTIQKMFEEAVDEIKARYASGYLLTPLELQPRETTDFTLWLDGEASQEYSDWNMEMEGFEDELFANILMHTHDNGVHAAHNIQPMYYPTWVRDSVFTLNALRKEGEEEPMVEFYKEFLPEVQRDNGSFNQCFYPDGNNAGTWYSEMDQPAIAAAKFPELDQHLDGGLYSDPDARACYAASLKRVLENIKDGQVAASPDFSELPTDFFRQSLWTQSFAYESLKLAARYGNIQVRLSDVENPPDILRGEAENGVFRLESELLKEKADEIKRNSEQTYFNGDIITNEGLFVNSQDSKTVQAKILEDTSLLLDLGRDREFLESLEPDSNEYWSPGFASYGKVLDMYGEDNSHIKRRIRNSRTDVGKLPERVTSYGWRDSMELAWGSAEAMDLLRNH